MAAIKKRSLVDQVYEMLRGDIITLRRPLGSKLNVNELQDELGVSCTPIREAVNRLQQEGLVVYENNVGAHILDLDQHDITEIEQLAMTLHCAAIRLAMAHGDRAAIVTGLEKYLEEYRRARNVQSEVMAVNRFVGTFYAHCGNRRLDANMISIQGQQLLLRYIYADCLTERGSHVEDFEGMLEAARRGDAEEVCVCLQRNTDRCIPVLMEYFFRELFHDPNIRLKDLISHKKRICRVRAKDPHRFAIPGRLWLSCKL